MENFLVTYALHRHSLQRLSVPTLVLTISLAYIAYYLYLKVKAYLRMYKLASTIPGPKGYPIIGNVLNTYQSTTSSAFRNKTSELLIRNSTHQKNNIVRIWIFHKLFIFVKDPVHAQEVLKNMSFRKSNYYHTIFSETALGQGILTNIDSKVWKRQRKIITPTFHFRILHTYIKYFYEESLHFCDIISKEAKYGKPIPIDLKLKLAGFDMIVRNVLGIQINAQDNPEHPFLENIIETMQLTQMRIYQPWLLIKPLFRLLGYHRRQMKATREINAFMQDVINLKRKDSEKEQMQNKETKVVNTNINRKEFEEESNEGKQEEIEKSVGEKEIEADRKEEYADVQYQFTKTKSFLELLLEIGNSSHEKLTDAELLPELTTLFFAALDTTSTSNTTTLLLLAMHPEVLQKVTDEIDSIFGGPEKDDGRMPTPSDLSKMTYLECVLKENSRMFPAAPLVSRQLDEEMPLGNHILPVDTHILIIIAAIHRNWDYWEHPRHFIPERFLADEAASSPYIKERHPYAFIPFSAGPRNCVGQKYALLQMKTVTSTILRRFHLRPSPKFQSVSDIDQHIRLHITLRLEEGEVIFIDRKTKEQVSTL